MSRGRRSFLRGAAGLTLALPLLEWNEREVQAAGTPARRFIVMFSHGGTISCRNRNGGKEDGTESHHGWDLWAPPTESLALSALGEEMEPLTPHASDLILLRGVDNRAGMAADYGGGHGTSNVTAMTAADFDQSGDDALALGASLDQVLAERLQLQNPTPFPSIDLAIHGHNYGGPFFRKALEKVSSERNPVLAYAQIFGGLSPSGELDPELVRIRAMRRSVLDGVLDGFGALQKRVGKSDALRLESHAEHIRGMELQLDALDELAACTLPGTEGAVDDEWYGAEAEHVGPLMVDFVLHAMRCGLSNVATLQIGDLLTTWLPSPHDTDLGHSLGHTARDIGATGPDHAIAADSESTR
jgi:hypothetical protein